MRRVFGMEKGYDVPTLSTSRIHVVGLGGTGVRGLVPLLLARGARISGSDLNESPVLEKLRGDGVECKVGHCDSNVSPETDLVLISAAVQADNPEVKIATERRIAVLKYAQCLGYLMSEKQGVAIAGTHGKTTTSAMVALTLLEAGLDPSFVIGGEYPEFGGGSRSGKGAFFVAEACEYDRSFLNLRPTAAVVTNIEADHLDYFRSLQEIQEAFAQFAGLLPPEGILVCNHDDEHSRPLPAATGARAVSFGLTPNPSGLAEGPQWWADDVEFNSTGARFLIVGPHGQAARVQLRIPGIHNVRNSLACAAICDWAGVPIERTALALERFRGVRRRFDVLLREPVTIIDDYAHHPTEVEAVIASARQTFPGNRLVCVFQPHQYSRLRAMRDRFAAVLSFADEVLVTGVYRARDTDEDAQTVHADSLADEVRALGGSAEYAPGFSTLRQLLTDRVEPGTVIVFLGAGDISSFAWDFTAEVKRLWSPVPLEVTFPEGKFAAARTGS